ncbi:MAG TPA: 30S ribosomal protein S2 [Candidatus Saccharimonadales bacterium]|nr:30S ribosomal protein S2 [Candidatus Saccharimonadales bacterium]
MQERLGEHRAKRKDFQLSKVNVDVKALLEAGAHFGHRTSRWHPKMAPYIHSKRDGSHIIDLTKTVSALDEALDFLARTAATGKQILLVSTKRQAKDKVKEVADATGMPYVTVRWLGGMLTNQPTVGARIRHLKDLETRMANGDLEARYNKLEVQRFAEEIEEMNRIYGGIKELNGMPAAVFVVDVLTDYLAVKEAKKLGIPVIGLADSNVDPTQIEYPVPCNDDAVKTIDLILDYVKQAIEEGKSKAKTAAKTDDKPEAAAQKPAEPAKQEAR